MLAAEIVIPFVCAVAYSIVMLLIKRSYQDGVGPCRHLLTVTLILGAVYAVLLRMSDFPESIGALRFPAIGAGTLRPRCFPLHRQPVASRS
jgi:hypothetical protein